MMNLMNKAGIYTLIMCMEAVSQTGNQKRAREWGIEDYLVIWERLKWGDYLANGWVQPPLLAMVFCKDHVWHVYLQLWADFLLLAFYQNFR